MCTHMYANSLLKNTSIKHNKYVVNQKLEHVDDISFRQLFSRIRLFYTQYDRSLPSARHVYLRWPFFLKTHSWKNSLFISFSLE